jgi:hypothetical protein
VSLLLAIVPLVVVPRVTVCAVPVLLLGSTSLPAGGGGGGGGVVPPAASTAALASTMPVPHCEQVREGRRRLQPRCNFVRWRPGS